MSDKLTYRQIKQRCVDTAHELAPGYPESGGYDAWEDHYETLEDFDVSQAVWESLEGWDWTIYTHYGMQIIDVLSSSELNDAEARWHELDGPSTIDDSFGVYEFAAKVAYFALDNMLSEVLSDTIEEMKEVAQMEMDNAVSAS